MSSKATRVGSLFNVSIMALAVSASVNLAQAGAPIYESFGGAVGSQMDARFDVLTAAAQDKGTVRVIVRLKEAQSMQSASGEMNVRTYRAGIASTQSRVMSTLTTSAGVRTYKTIPYMAMEVDAIDLAALRQSSEVEAVFEDRLESMSLAESVPLIGAAQEALSGYSGAGQTIAILDTGVDKTHPDLVGKVVAEACFSTPYSDGGVTGVCPNGQTSMIGEGAAVPCSVNTCNHGTHVAGIAAGRQGVAKDANIIAVQVFAQVNSEQSCAQAGWPAPCTLTWINDQLAALDYIHSLTGQLDIAAVNMSLGGGEFSKACDDDPRTLSINNLHSVGVATVVASGNEGFVGAIASPACISNAITVGGTDKQDGNYVRSNSSQQIDLLAPGVEIMSSVPGGSHASFSGTSMAAPHVAGAFAVLKGKTPEADVNTILSALTTSGVPVIDRDSTTRPRIQVDQALTALNGGGSEPGDCTLDPSNPFVEIGINQSLDCELSTSDVPLNGQNGTVFSKGFHFVAPGGTVTISADSQAFSPMILILDRATNQWLDMAPGTLSGDFAPGDVYVVVTSEQGNATGPFTVQVQGQGGAL